MSGTLKNLLDRRQQTEEEIIAAYGEISPEMEASLIELDVKLPAKVDRCIGFLNKLEVESQTIRSRGEAIKDQADKFLKAAKQIDNFVDHFENHIRNQMQANGLTKLEGEYEEFKLAEKKGKLKIEPGIKAPAEYYTQEISEKLNTSRLKSDIENGLVLPGITITPTLSRKVKRK